MKQTHCSGGGGANKQHPHGGGGKSMQQTLRRGDGVGGENKRQTHCGSGGGESRQRTAGSSAARVVQSGDLLREMHQIALV
jgi:hypothetical protein